jgi:hypothetical protein
MEKNNRMTKNQTRKMKRIAAILVVLLFTLACYPAETAKSGMVTITEDIASDTPMPESSSTPTITATSVSSVEDSAILLSDDFSDQISGWNLYSQEDAKYYYANGEYIIQVVKNDSYYMSTSNKSLDEGVFSVEMRHVEGDDVITNGMVFWRYQDDNNFYALQVNDEGQFSIHRFFDGQFGLITLPIFTNLLNTNGEVNKITIVFHAEDNEIYFNDQFAYHFIDNSIERGSVGLGAFPSLESDVRIAFDNLTVHKYDPSNEFTPLSPQFTPTPQYVNLSWQELTRFLADDHTNWREYDLENYNCLDYAIDLVANARYANIDAKIVTVQFVGQPTGHAFVAFETSDRGTIFVEPQGDNTYSNVDIGNYLCDDWGEFECMGTIESVEYFGTCDHAQNCTVIP